MGKKSNRLLRFIPSKSDLLLWEEVRILSQDLKEGYLAVAKRRQGVPRDWSRMYKNSVAKALSTEQGDTMWQVYSKEKTG